MQILEKVVVTISRVMNYAGFPTVGLVALRIVRNLDNTVKMLCTDKRFWSLDDTFQNRELPIEGKQNILIDFCVWLSPCEKFCTSKTKLKPPDPQT